MAEASLEQVPERPPSEERAWPPTLWNWKNAIIILVLWFGGFIAVNVVQVLIVYGQAGLLDEIAAGNVEALETAEFVVSFEVQAVTFVGLAVVSLGAVALVNALGPKNGLREFGFRPMERRWWLWAAGLGVGLAAARIGLAYGLFALIPSLEEGAEALAAMLVLPDPGVSEVLLSIFFISLLVPLSEEVFFRGFLHNWLRNRLPMWAAIMISSLAFGLIHFIPVQIITAFLLGAAMAWIYEKSGSLWSAVLLHVVNNGLVALLTYIPMLVV
ncbi:MAG: lysostaphin resistance A-like protein [Anaerolineae bacterium]